MNVAVLGLGLMGLPMAANLARAGFAVQAWNRGPRELPDVAGLRLAAT
ncbi:NAD(P)-binding domain-containing protein, partial [Frankia sp. Cr1]